MALRRFLSYGIVLSTFVSATIDLSLCSNPTFLKTELKPVPSGGHINMTTFSCGVVSTLSHERTAFQIGDGSSPPIKISPGRRKRAASECEFTPCACGESCDLTACVVDKVPITPSDCVALSNGLRSLSGEFIVLQPSNVEVLSAGTCETAFYNRQTTADLQVCLDDWAGLVAGLNTACPGDFAQCQGESLTGVIGQQWIIQQTPSSLPLDPPS
ncbi:hypothetical protein SISSUDRAFT_1128631 [Sistotremastrum suecicum HHB10207 ss-3]|uniref:Uncharacterized protein n=1 Tax=Sistotremastrum suecicum HHB10207 ss-3 TaxID=1314776 RepID=A0A166DL30_9AGAM|nr:hypothetical protein SISSUDRAFT_1128631 [Sistotremastrum suecicum HHB10207 ss-3]